MTFGGNDFFSSEAEEEAEEAEEVEEAEEAAIAEVEEEAADTGAEVEADVPRDSGVEDAGRVAFPVLDQRRLML